MKIEIFEFILVGVIISIQFYVFLRTYLQIKLFKNIIPGIDSIWVSKIFVPKEELENVSPKEILGNLEAYKSSLISNQLRIADGDFEDNLDTDLQFDSNHQGDIDERVEVTILESKVGNKIFKKILFSINNYLVRNRGAATDFNLTKDIVERNIDAVEEDINLSISVPLYLGLMGTMIGIVIGLFNMPDLGVIIDTQAKDSLLNTGIATLIGGVKIAMIASFTGLMFTIINSGWIFKGARSKSEGKKNEFYTFIQIELLPLINQGLASTLDSLQRNLLKFNDEFSTNLKGLKGVFDSSKSAIIEQKKLLVELDKSKISMMARYNVSVLQQLNISVEKFEKFNSYLTNVTEFVASSQQIVSKTNALLARTENFKKIADSLENRLNQSEHLLQFLSMHFGKLEEFKEFTSNAVADVGFAISDTFKELKVHIQNSSEAVKQFTVDETNILKDVFAESRTSLDNLENLEILKTDVSEFKLTTTSQGSKIEQSIEKINENMLKSVASLEQIIKENFSKKNRSIRALFMNLFKSRKL